MTEKTSTNMPNARRTLASESHAVLDSDDPAVYAVTTKAEGPVGALPLSDEMLRE